jgi:hypothetical protein
MSAASRKEDSTMASITSQGEVSLVRLYVLRTTYVLLVVGLGASNLPDLISHEPTARGVIPSMLGGIWLVAFLGIRYPLQMLPAAAVRARLENDMADRLWAAPKAFGPDPRDLCRGFRGDHGRRDSDAARDPMGIHLASLCHATRRTLASRSRKSDCSRTGQAVGCCRLRKWPSVGRE